MNDKMKDKTMPAYMPMPDGCGRGAQPVFGGVKCVDILICSFYCTKPCQTYSDFCGEWDAEKKKRKKESLKVNLEKPRRQALETI